MKSKKNNIKGYNKIIRGGMKLPTLTTPQIKAKMAASTNPKSVPKKAPNFNTRIKELQEAMGSNKNVQFIQEQMAEDARINEARRQEYMTKFAYLQQIQRLGQMQQDEKEHVSQQLRKELQDLRIYLEQKIKDYRNMARKMQNNANRDKNLRNWVNKTLPLLEATNRF